MHRLFTHIACLLVCLTPLLGFSAYENPYQHDRGHYSFIYQITNDQAEALIDYKQPDSTYYTALVDSFPITQKYKKQLKPGYYIKVTPIRWNLEYELISKNSFEAVILEDEQHLILQVYDKTDGSYITNAQISVGKSKFKFDAKTNNYTCKTRRRWGRIKIDVNGELMLMSMDVDKTHQRSKLKFIATKLLYSFPLSIVSRPVRKLVNMFKYRDWRTLRYMIPRWARRKSRHGYLATNQPMYRHGDTVQIKAYITKFKGNALHRDLEVSFGSRYDKSARTVIGQVSPTRKGYYEFSFVLGDTLKIDRNYWVFLGDRKHFDLVSNSFKLEDYQLDQINYSIRTGKKYYEYGEPIQLFAEGKDINALTIPDGRLDLTIAPHNVWQFHSDTVRVYETMLEKTFQLDPLGETKITIPASELPDCNVQFKVEAKFNNSNNETFDTTFYVNYNGQPNLIDVRSQKGVVTANLIKDGKAFKGFATMYGLLGYDTLYKKRVNLPWQGKIDQKVNQFYFKNPETDGSLSFHHSKDSLEPYGFLRNDTLIFGATNPLQLEFEYRLYKLDKLVKSGTSSEFPLMLKHKGSSAYTLKVQYFYAGYTYDKKVEVAEFNKWLNVAITQPQIVQPGDSVDIEVEVTNSKGKPVSNIDVTAGAINNEFDKDNSPKVPYLGKRKRSRGNYRRFTSRDYKVKRSVLLTDQMRERYHLDTISWYQLMYPKDGLQLLYHDIDSGVAAFSPYAVSSVGRHGIYFIYLDGELIFSETASEQQPYAFKAAPGYHNVKIRTKYDEFTIDSVLFKEGKKLEMSIRIYDAPDAIKSTTMPDTITYAEQRLLDRHMVKVRNNVSGRKWLKQGDRMHLLDGSDRVYTAGPFTRDSIEFIIEKDTSYHFLPEAGYEYLFTPEYVKLYEAEENPKKQNKLGNFTYWPIGNIPRHEREIVYKAASAPQVQTKRPWFKEMPRETYSYRGEYQIEVDSDSLISLIRLQHLNNYSQHPIYQGYTRTFANLRPGYYQLQLYTPNGYTWKHDSVHIIKGSKYFQRLEVDNFQPLPSTEWFTDSLSAELGKDTTASYQITYSDVHTTLRGYVYDADTKEPLPFVNVRLSRDGEEIAGASTDFEGLFEFSNPGAGRFTIDASFIGFEKRSLEDIVIKEGGGAFVHFGMSNDYESLQEVEVVAYSVPLLLKESSTLMASMQTISSNDIAFYSSVVPGVTSTPTIGGEADIATAFPELPTTVDINTAIAEEATTSLASTGLKLRTEFRDYAFFEHLITDKDGKAKTTVKFPDNVTAWKTNAYAMNSRRQGGSGSTITKAYKQLTAQAALPRFLIEGDRTEVIGKSMNYDATPHQITTYFLLGTDTIHKNDTSVTNAVIDRVRISTPQQDSAQFTYFLSRADGYTDGERRSIPILPKGSKEHRGKFMILENDTTITIRIDTFAKGDVTLTTFDNQLSWLMNQSLELQNYPYACMEQTASKLRGYLAAAQIESFQKKADFDTQPIYKLIKRLEDNQRYDGSWGWWPGSNTNTFMTCYVMEVLWEAKKQGYESKALVKGEEWLIEEAELAASQDLVNILHVLAKMDAPLQYEKFLQKARLSRLGMYAQFQAIEIRQLQKLPYSLHLVDSTRIETLFGNYYWGESRYNWHGNRYTQTLLAFKILEHENPNSPVLARIRDYFLEDKKNTKYMNTIQQATLVQTLLPSIMKQYGTNFEPVKVVFANDTVGYYSAPFKRTFDQSQGEITLTKTGAGPLYLSIDQQFWNSKPDSVGKTYAVNSWFERDHSKIDTLTAGSPVELIVQVEVKKSSEYMMIEVPIPAGCSYHGDSKGSTRNYRESYRERFKDKTSIFCESLPAGTYQFRVALQPRYSGEYHLNPVHIEQMYFPVFFGRGISKKAKIAQ